MTTLVIIDDHEALRNGLEVLLGQAGLDVVGAAGNVAAGLDLLLDVPGHPHGLAVEVSPQVFDAELSQ